MFTINLFGSPAITLNGEKVSGFASRKAEGVLLYLAHSNRQVARETLATLLWDDRSHEQALANLSVLLSSLRKTVGAYLNISRHEVGLIDNPHILVDTRQFEAKLCEAERKQASGEAAPAILQTLQQAAALYSDHFLTGFSLRDASGFEEWLFIERERLQRIAIHTMEQIARLGIAERKFSEAILNMHRLLAIDPLHEPGYRLLMDALAKDGQRSAAIEVYQECKQRLQGELDVTPSVETTALYDLIRNNQVTPSSEVATLPRSVSQHARVTIIAQELFPPPTLPKHNLPKRLNNFVGRQQELAELSSLFDDENYRLLSLVGPGGIGKTRLAIECAYAAVSHARNYQPDGLFKDGVLLIELDALSATDQILNKVADVLDYRFVDGQRRQEELSAYLQQKQMLLVFDNFEHLLDAAAWLQQLLEHAPAVRALTTSRERLNLPGETVIEVCGLTVPPPDESSPRSPNQYSAIELFVDRAQRVNSQFRLTPAETDHLIRICQQLDGVPLAIELAAAWVHTLSCAEIASELAQSIDFLVTTTRGTPQRHSSLRAVFEHSWQLLNSAEQQALAQFSVFRGGFSREAATQIAKANLRVLITLLDKSLIRRISNNRYTIHPLLGQFSREKLALFADEARQCQQRHAHYFARFMHQRKDDLEGSRQLDALAEMDTERENLRTAYHWALEQTDLEAIDLAMEAFLAYLDVRCHGIEAIHTAERSQQMLEPLALTGNRQAHWLWGRALVEHAMFRSFEYDNDLAVELAKQALTVLQAHHDQAGVAFSHNSLGLAQMQRGEMENALVNFEKAAELRKSLGKNALVASSLINIAQLAWRRGEYRKAEAVCQTALLYAQKSENPWRIAMVFNVLGILAKELEQYNQAQEYLQQSIETYQAVGNRWGSSSIISERGVIALLQKKYTLARSYFEQSIAIRRDLGNVLHRAGDLLWLGKVAEVQEQRAEAESHYQEALQLLEAVDEPINKASALFLLAKLRFTQGMQGVSSTLEQFQIALQLAQSGDSQPLLQEIREEIEKVNQ